MRRDENAWRASAFYADGVRKRRTARSPLEDVSGKFAIEVWAGSRDALQPDLDAFEARTDIGRVEVWFGLAGVVS